MMIVGNVKCTSGFFNEQADFRIMNTANFWKQVMLELKDKSEYHAGRNIPGQKPD
jgi:hypothetical protein